MVELESLNSLSTKDFVFLLGDIFEHSPWIAEASAIARPFTTVHDLHQHMVKLVEQSPHVVKINLLRAHPDLGANIEMSSDSMTEQQGAGLKELTPDEYESFLSLNKKYRQKFGFPFITAVRGKNKHIIYETLKQRLLNDLHKEFQIALTEVYTIAFFRLNDKIKQ
jgi:OHCU decarboxylase